MSNWISVEDRMPELNEGVLVARKNTTDILMAFHSLGAWHEVCENLDVQGYASHVSTEIQRVDIGDTGYQITHWMELPEPPNQA